MVSRISGFCLAVRGVLDSGSRVSLFAILVLQKKNREGKDSVIHDGDFNIQRIIQCSLIPNMPELHCSVDPQW